ncbi:DNA sulfur modification protein DndE [Catenulispora pinisilvae]|uniref:DNA sulfur modification protein DndE n=1 Tax=Catenulispora pinisilvae TaxID=2705253 RepID=UPI002B26E85D|nr:DNA sulfur modification protein DndE [Catenulispora pinisilvae]
MSTRKTKTQSALALVPPPEVVRLGSDIRDTLTTLKRRTGVANSNVLCRWALCRSLAEPSAPTSPAAPDNTVEIAWKVFSGTAGDLYWWLLKMHCHELGMPLDETTLNTQLRWHIARGASYLVGDKEMRDATSLANLAIVPETA